MSVENHSEHGSHLLHVRKDCGVLSVCGPRVPLLDERKQMENRFASWAVLKCSSGSACLWPSSVKMYNRLQVARDPFEDRHPHFEKHCIKVRAQVEGVRE